MSSAKSMDFTKVCEDIQKISESLATPPQIKKFRLSEQGGISQIAEGGALVFL